MSDRQQYLLDVAARMWPGAELALGRRGPGTGFVLVPDARNPRLVLPASPTAAAAAVRAYGGHGSRSAWLRTQAVAAAFSLGLGHVLVRDRLHVGPAPDGDLVAELAAALGRPVTPALHIGPPRANRKPVLALVDGAETVGYAKLGTGPLTRSLVEAETRALEGLARVAVPGVRVPRVLHAGDWRDLALLVQEPLPVRSARPTPDARRTTAMVAVARAHGVTPIAGAASPFVGSLRRRLAALPGTEPAGALGAALTAALRGPGTVLVEHGSWHGDWTPWNTAATPAEVLVWDWERFAVDVPLGMDALHHHLQSSLARAAAPTVAHVLDLLGNAARLLAPFGVGPEAADRTARLYLVSLAVRYLADDQAATGSPVGDVASWLVPALHPVPG